MTTYADQGGSVPESVVAMRRWQRSYITRLVCTDFLVVVAVVAIVQLIVFGAGQSGLLVSISSSQTLEIGYWVISAILAATWVVFLGLTESRDRKIVGTGNAEYSKIAKATAYTYALLAVVALSLKVEVSRSYILLTLISGWLLLTVSRWLWRKWLVRQRQAGGFSHRAVLLGDVDRSRCVAEQISQAGASGIEIVGAVSIKGTGGDELIPGVPLTSDKDPIEAGKKWGADTVIFTGSDVYGSQELKKLGWLIEDNSMELIFVAALTDVAGPRVHTRPVAGLPLVQIDYPNLDTGRRVAKRVFDLVASGVGLIVLSPVFAVIAVLIRVTSPGPIFFLQDRGGLNGKPFKMFKFRSMVVDAEARRSELLEQSDGDGTIFKMRDDPRVTKIGRFLRRYSLDELPQILNVFLNDMSLVGPRPHPMVEVEQYDHLATRRLLVKPGITGLWQTSGRSNLSWEESIRLDLYYVENWSFMGDFVILFRTAKAVIGSDGAY
jgi:exopolysaccharide biosynthesis polyprenyl glycosylphosphotransferase